MIPKLEVVLKVLYVSNPYTGGVAAFPGQTLLAYSVSQDERKKSYEHISLGALLKNYSKKRYMKRAVMTVRCYGTKYE